LSGTAVILNPRSRAEATGKRLAELVQLLERQLGEHRLLLTESEGDGRRLAYEALEGGATRLVAAGGDGTLNEVVSGLFTSGKQGEVEVALLSLGSGGDFARLLGLGGDLAKSLRRLETGRRRRVDVGCLHYRDPEGKPALRWFLNIASCGLTGEAVLWLAEQGRLGKRGPLSYMESGLRGLLSGRSPRVTVRVDGQLVHDGPVLLAAIANGQYFGGGMHVAPHALLDDGQFDLVLIPAVPKLAGLMMFPAIFVGHHLRDSRVRVVRGREVELESDEPVWLEADGEPVTRLPLRIELLPSALTLCGLP
jgi:YegS/Rv2252/BmrU family lipid kinase